MTACVAVSPERVWGRAFWNVFRLQCQQRASERPRRGRRGPRGERATDDDGI